MTPEQTDLAVRVVDGNAGALAFVQGLINEEHGWELLTRIDVERPNAKGSGLFLQAKNAGTVLAMTRDHADLTFTEIALKLLVS